MRHERKLLKVGNLVGSVCVEVVLLSAVVLNRFKANEMNCLNLFIMSFI